MWLGYLPTPPNQLELLIRFDKNIAVGGVKIWNYNKGILDCTKGIYLLQVLLNDQLKWTGQLSPGKGQINVDYSKAIVLKENAEGFELPKEVIPEPPQQQPSKQENLVVKPLPSLSSAQSMRHLGSGSNEDNALEDSKTTEERLRQYRSKLELA